MSKLFSPIRLRDLNIKNRIFMAPMCQYSAHDGLPDDWHRIHYGARAAGGVGLVMMEARPVNCITIKRVMIDPMVMANPVNPLKKNA